MLFKNTAAQSASYLTAYLFSLVLAPVMLARLGLEQFGVWAVTGAMATYMGLADFGITRSLARFVALYDVQGDRRGIAECIGLGLLAITGVGVVGAGVAVLIAPLLQDGLGVLSVEDYRNVLLCSVAIFTFTAYRRVLNSVDVGLRQMVPPNVATVFTNILNFAFSLAALLLVEPNLVTYAAANAAAYLVGIAAAALSVRHVWGSIPVAWPSAARAREVVSFSAKTQVHELADLVNLQTDKIILAFVVGARAAGAYEIAARVVVAVHSVGLLALSAMLPTFTAHIAEHGRDALPHMYRRYTTITLALAFPIMALACVTAPFLLKAWIGELPEHASGVVILLTLAYLCTISCEVGINIATGDGRPGLVASNSILTAAANVILTLALAPLLGFWGVVAGSVLALVGGSAAFVVRFHHAYRLPLRDFGRAVMRPAVASLGLAAAIVPWVLLLDVDDLTRVQAAVVVLLVSAAYGGVYWLIASGLRILPAKLTLRAA